MRNITLNIDTTQYSEKPDKNISTIQENLKKGKTTMTVQQLIDYMNNGSTMKAAALNGNKNINWESQEVFAIDIDSNLTIEQALHRCKKYNIAPTFYYTTFNHTESHHKFRLVFISEVKVTDIRIRNVIQMALMNIFPESDKACKDLSRVFFGSNKRCKVLDLDATIEILPLIHSMISFIQDTDLRNSARIISNYAKSVGLNTVNGLPNVFESLSDKNDLLGRDIIGAVLHDHEKGQKQENIKIEELGVNLIYILLDDHEFPQKQENYNFGDLSVNLIEPLLHDDEFNQKRLFFDFNIKEDEYSLKAINTEGKKSGPKVNINNTKIKSQELIRDLDFDKLQEKCELYNDLITGKWLYHNQVFGLATNLWRYMGAQKRFIDAIESNSSYADTFNKTNTIKTASKQQYAPKRCIDFCPHKNTCENQGLNITHIINQKKNNIRKISDFIGIELDDAYKQISTAIESKMNDTENKMSVLVAPTGIGKTNMLFLIAKENPELFNNTVIAVPNHTLLNELVEKMKPALPNLLHLSEILIEDEILAYNYEIYQSTGQYQKAKNLLLKYQKSLTSDDSDKIKEIDLFLNSLRQSSISSNPIFCTHKRLTMLNNPNINKYIIDEDIISTVHQTVTLNRTEIIRASQACDIYKIPDLKYHFDSLLEFITKLENTQNTVVKNKYISKIVSSKDFAKLLKHHNPQCNLMDMLKIEAAIRTNNGVITGYINNNTLPDKPIMILSATANETIYKSIFNDRKVEYLKIDNVKSLGRIIHHYGGMSRNYLNQHLDKAITKVKKEAPGVKNIITFKDYSAAFATEGFSPICHYGKSTGIDSYGGEDLIVLGTPHVNIVVYLLLAYACGIQETINIDMDFVNVIKNGFEYTFSTFNHNDLSPKGEMIREIQDYIISSEIIQAVGRARILRNNCTVHLFSNYPLAGSELFNKKI